MQSKLTTKALAKVAAVAAGLAMAASVFSVAPIAQAASLTDAQVQSILSLLSSFGANSATIANVQSALTGTAPTTTTTGSTTTTTSSCSFTKDLTIGATGTDVTCLQQALIAGGYSIPAGATGYFGNQTKTAVIAWQTAVGVSPTSGYFGSISRAHWNLGGTTTTTGGTTTTTGGTTTTVTGNGLKVSLSPTSPNGSVLVQGQGIGDLGEFVFSNPTASPINVTALTFNRTGVSNDSTLTNVYLYNNGTRITDSAGVSNGSFTFSDPTALFTVPAGQTYTVAVRSDIIMGSAGQMLGVSLVSVTSNGTLDSSVSFPIMSGYQSIASADLATVSYNSNVTPAPVTAPTLYAATISPQNDYPIWQDTVAVSTNPVKLTSMRFTNLGSIDGTYVTNLRLYVDGVQVGSAIPSMNADRTVTFDLSSSPVTLSTQSHVIKVLANITGGASRTIQFSVQRSSDAMFVDAQLGQPVTPEVGSGNFSAVTTGPISINSVSASSGVSVSRDPSSPNQSVATGAPDVKWASFDFLASGENVKVSDLYVYADTNKATGAAISGLNNGKIMVNGVQVGSTHDLVEYDGAAGTSANATDFSLGSSLILPAGQTTVVDIYADAQYTNGSNLDNNSTVTVYLASASSNAQGQSSLNSTNVPSTTYGGNAVVVSNSSLTASESTGYGDQTIIPGASHAKIGSFALSTGSTEGVTVNTITVDFASAVSATISKLTLEDATGATLGSAISYPSTSNSFSVNLDIPASSSKTIDVYADVFSTADNGTIQAAIDQTTGGTGDLTGTASQVGGTSLTSGWAAGTPLQSIGLGAGLLTVTQGAGDPTSNNVVAGSQGVSVGEFSFSAQHSPYTVQNMAILVPYAQANDVSYVTLTYKDANNATHTTPKQALVKGSSGYATATFIGLSMYVPADGSATVDVSVDIPTIVSSATSGAGIKVSLANGSAGSTTFRAVDSAGTATSTLGAGGVTTAGGTFYVRKSIPTFAVVTSGTTLATGQPLYAFSITSDVSNPIDWSHVAFNVSTSTNTSITNMYLTDSSGTDLLNTPVNADANGLVSIDLTSNHSGNVGYQQVSGTKTYYLKGIVSTTAANYTVTIGLAPDGTVATTNGQADGTGITTGGTKNIIWSDRSASNHSVTSNDWTNGYLIKDLASTAISYRQ